MEISIREIDPLSLRYVNRSDNAYVVDSKLLINAENGKISYSVVDVPPYTKRFQPDEIDYSTYISNPDKTVFFAFIEGNLAGQIRVLKWWNGYAYIGSIVVDKKYRKQGVGRVLIDKVVEWTKAKGLPGIMLETQSNNVAACTLYQRCGFVLGGFDEYLYKGLNPATEEVALYWYLVFNT
jgi:ribosomal protein S18 acetylase RimI-like enzyme